MSFNGVLSLTYDGGALCHVETVLPQLDRHGICATFYVDPVSLLENLPEWGRAVSRGHEIGNGSLFAAAGTDGQLEGWTEEMVEDDLRSAKELIEGQSPEQTCHSVAFPWRKSISDPSEWLNVSTHHYQVTKIGANKKYVLQASRLGVASLQCDDMSAKEIIDAIETALQSDPWLVLSFQGVGVGDPAIDASVHDELCERVSTMKSLSVVPVIQAASRIAADRSGVPRLL